MATITNIISRKFYKQWINGSTFSNDLTNFTTNLAGLVMQKIKAVYKIEVKTNVSSGVAANQDPGQLSWSITPLNVPSNVFTFTRNDGGDFTKENFELGESVRTGFTSVSLGNFFFVNATITKLTVSEIEITFVASPTLPLDLISASVVSRQPLTALKYLFGILENAETFNNISLITNESMGWYSLDTIGAGSPRSTSFVNMGGIGLPKSWENGSARVRFVSGVDTQIFEVEHEFIIPYYQASTDINTTPDWLIGNNSLRYGFEADFLSVISNPNTAKPINERSRLGSVGYFGETFNGLDSNYKINSVTYTDNLLANADGILIGGKTFVTIQVEKLMGNFGADNVGIYFSYLPELQAEVENTLTNFEENFMYDNIFAQIGGGATAGAGILNNIVATAVGNILTITFETQLPITQQLRITNESSYVIGVEVGDSTIQAGNSDAVMLLETKNFDASSDISGLVTLFENRIKPHTFVVNSGVSDFEGWNEDGLNFDGGFGLDLTKKAFLNSFSLKLVAYNSLQNSYFELDSIDLPLTNQTLNSSGFTYQLINTIGSRNYPLPTGDIKNEANLIFNNNSIGLSIASFAFSIGQKISWESWIKNNSVDNVFLDFNKENDNKNIKASNYSSLNGYEIKACFVLNIFGENSLGQSGNTDYLFLTPDLRIFDYDKDGNTPPQWSGVIETFTADGLTNLLGAVQIGADTLFVTTWSSTTPISDITSFYGIHRIEQSGQTGKQLFELSTTENNLQNQLLKPISGLFLDMQLIGGQVVTKCLIDGSKVQTGINYNLSSRIKSPRNSKDDVFVKITENNITKATNELNETKILN